MTCCIGCISAACRVQEQVGRDRIFIFDSNLRVIFFSPASEGYTLPDLIGTPMVDTLVQADRRYAETKARRVIEQGTSVQWVVRDLKGTAWSAHLDPFVVDGKYLGIGCAKPACPEALDLPKQQRLVLLAICDRLGVVQIARKYGVSENTVRTHLRRAKEKVGRDDMNDLIVWAMEHRAALERGA